MNLFTKFITLYAKKHAKNFANIVDCRFDPLLGNAIVNKLNNKINCIFSEIPNNNFNPEYEVLENAIFDGIGIGVLDNITDFFKQGYLMFKYGKYIISSALVTYKNEFIKNIPSINSGINLRKGNVDENELNIIMKKIFKM